MHARKRADAVDADAQAHHVVLVLREALNAGGIEDVAHGPVADPVHDALGVPIEEVELGRREGVLLRVFRHAQVREDRLDLHFGMRVQEFDECGNLRGHEAQAVHAGIQLDVDRVIPQALADQIGAESVEGFQVGDAGLHPGLDDLRIEVRAGGEDDDREADTVLAELQALDRIGDGKVVGARPLHHRGELHGAVAVRIRLDENQQFRRRVQQGSEITVVAYATAQVQLQPGEIILTHHASFN